MTEILQLWFFDPGSLGQRPQDTFLKSKVVGSKFITHSKCPEQPVAQSWVVVKSESDFEKFCNYGLTIVSPVEAAVEAVFESVNVC